MKKINLKHAKGRTKILIGESINNIGKFIDLNKTIIITDSTVKKYYRHLFPTDKIVELAPGEKSKNLKTMNLVIEKLINYDAHRNSFLLGIGGGVVCDICAFSASIFNRGINFGLIATTLLAQADASIGGKNGVNFGNYKNIIGTIRQADFVISDMSLLKTLPKREFNNGVAEIIKTALISDDKFFAELENVNLNSIDVKKLEDIIFRTAKFKTEIVQKDEYESGLRRVLNFGHTFAHAVESVYRISHGRAVSIGMMKALEISNSKTGLNREIIGRVKNLLIKNNLPYDLKMDRNKMMDAIFRDKKRDSSMIRLILLENIGKAAVVEMSFDELLSYV